MEDGFLDCLRCPIDPDRNATLRRDQQTLDCGSCHVHFPIKNGLPILIEDEADLPAGVKAVADLPCRRRKREDRAGRRKK